MNFGAVEWQIKSESALIADASVHNSALTEAMSMEIQNLIENDFFEEIDDDGREFIDTKWEFTEKSDGAKSWVKARLVAKGF